ncbi:MAG: DUF4384 domain-containing protein [Bryobacteraceae bacterium]
MVRNLPVVVCWGVVAALLAAQTKPRLTARQLFYSEGAPGSEGVAKSSGPKVENPKSAPKVVARRTAPKAPKRVEERRAEEKRVEEPVVAQAKPPGKAQEGPQATVDVPVREAVDTGGARYVNTGMREGKPIAIRYSLVKVADGGAESEVSPTMTFVSGDRVRLRVQGNQPGYLYVIARGSSGKWKPLFPSPEATDNLVEATPVTLPGGNRAWTMDQQTGEEQLLVVFSRTPAEDVDEMIENLQNRGGAAPPSREKPRMQLAMNLDDRFVSGLRTMYARDLIVETVEASAAAPSAADRPASSANTMENAVYVAADPESSGGRVVADIKLVHR